MSDTATVTLPDSPPTWRLVGCTAPGNPADHAYPWCGRPVHGAMRVGTYPLPANLTDTSRPEPGAILLCRAHFAAIEDAR